MLLVYKQEARGHEAPEGGVLINQWHPKRRCCKWFFCWTKGSVGECLIGFLPNKEIAREMRANPLQHYYCLCRRASAETVNRQAEMSVHYPYESLFLYEGDVLPISCSAIKGANCEQELAGESCLSGRCARWPSSVLYRKCVHTTFCKTLVGHVQFCLR